MNTNLDLIGTEKYHSISQKIRVITENWALNEVFCPNCGNKIIKYKNNNPVADFYCPNCNEDYELKSKQKEMGSKIVDGAYLTMIDRLNSSKNPNLFLMNYDSKKYEVTNFFVIPKQFFVPKIIEKRDPLSQNARRAGWVGCNIIIKNISQTGKIFYIKDKIINSKDKILAEWKRTLFLREEKKLSTKNWLLDIITCIDKLDKKEFTLKDIYDFEETLRKEHPNNKFIKDKIRQQLQILRDKNYLEFIGNGKYSLKV